MRHYSKLIPLLVHRKKLCLSWKSDKAFDGRKKLTNQKKIFLSSAKKIDHTRKNVLPLKKTRFPRMISFKPDVLAVFSENQILKRSFFAVLLFFTFKFSPILQDLTARIRSNALSYCQNLKSHLVYIETQEEQDFINGKRSFQPGRPEVQTRT